MTRTLPIKLPGLLLLGILVFSTRFEDSLATARPMPVISGSPFDTVSSRTPAYLWPTDASKKITSSFAEYRTTHFHGGIDISTNGVKGYKAFAVQDGYVFRVKISANGYGKMLFIKQSDGYISTYAHLQGFNEAIAQAVLQEQYKRGTYEIDVQFPPDKLQIGRAHV